MRITADGHLKVCLFGTDSFNILDYLRGNKKKRIFSLSSSSSLIRLLTYFIAGASDAEIIQVISDAVKQKHAILGGHRDAEEIAAASSSDGKSSNRPMILIGG